ncbi:hypothetical protein [Nocardia sp. NPDC052566]|uniref:hypothetical protein n=1 Tax=Nocardia sp. NPDC052566 TaxID=3364330 RepID=UPI0037CA1D3B
MSLTVMDGRCSTRQSNLRTTAVNPPRVEVIAIRDSDGPTDITVYINGQQAPTDEYVIDAGTGWNWDEWLEQRDANIAIASPGCLPHLIDAYDNPPSGHYIEERDDTDWLHGIPHEILYPPLTRLADDAIDWITLDVDRHSNSHDVVLNYLRENLRPGHTLIAHTRASANPRQTDASHMLYAAVADASGTVSAHVMQYRRRRDHGQSTIHLKHEHETHRPAATDGVTARLLAALSPTTSGRAQLWRWSARVTHEAAVRARQRAKTAVGSVIRLRHSHNFGPNIGMVDTVRVVSPRKFQIVTVCEDGRFTNGPTVTAPTRWALAAFDTITPTA